MPLLDFRCQQCGHKFEELVYSYNKEQLRCPECDASALDRVYEGRSLFGTLSTSRAPEGPCGDCAAGFRCPGRS